MRRRLNFKRVMLVLLVFVGTGAGVFFLHRWQVRQNSESLYARAQSALKDPSLSEMQKLTTAMNYLQRFLGFNPTHEEALFEYANLRAHEKIATSLMARYRAMTILDQALNKSRTPDERVKERRRLIDLALEVGRPADARQHVEVLLRDDRTDAELLGLLARCDHLGGKYAEARNNYLKALQTKKASYETYARYAGMLREHVDDLRRSGKSSDKPAELIKDADKYIERMVEAHPKNAKAYLARATYYRLFPSTKPHEQLVKQIEDDVLEARRLAKDDPEVLLELAELARFRKKPDLARSYLREGCDKHPDNWRLYHALGELDRLDGNLDPALAVLKKGLVAVPEQPDLLWSLAQVYSLQAAKADFGSTLARLKVAGMPPPELSFMEGRYDYQRKQWADAAKKLDEALNGLAGRIDGGRNAFVLGLARDAGLMLGECYNQLGDFDLAYTAFSRVATLAPQSAQARLGMAVAKRNMGQLDDAIANYRQLLRLLGAPGNGLVELARLTLARNLDRDTPDWQEVDRALSDAEQRVRPVPADVVLLRLEWFARQEKPEAARDYLVQLMVSNRQLSFPMPRLDQLLAAAYWQTEKLPAIYYISRAVLAELDGKVTEGLEWLERGAKEYDDPIYLRIARAGYWARIGGPGATKALGLLEGDLTRYSPEERGRLFVALAEANRALGQPAEEKRLWDRVVESSSDNLRAHLALFDLALSARDANRMKAEREAIKNIEGETGVLWRYAEVRRLLLGAEDKDSREESIQDAKRELAAVAGRRSNWSRVSLCEALIAELEGNPDLAADKYLEAFKRGERSVHGLSRGFELLSSRGRMAEAKQVLRKLPRRALKGNLVRLAAEVSKSGRDLGEAIRFADQALAGNPTDAKLHLWAGRIYWEVGQYDKAEAALRKACGLDRSMPEGWVALVYFLVTNEKKPKAVEALEEMKKAHTEQSAPLAFAQCYEVLGVAEKAAACYANALKAGPNDVGTLRALATYYLRNGKLQDAKGLLQRLAAEARTKAPEVASWAETALKVIAFAGADFKDSQKLLDDLGRPNALPPGADRHLVAVQRTRAALLAQQQGTKNRKEAIAILENLVALREATADDYFQLGRLYERQNNWPRASNHFTTMMEMMTQPAGQQIGYLVHFGRELLRNDDIAKAKQVLAALEKVAPKRLSTIEIKARILHKESKTSEAINLLEARTASTEEVAPTARLLEELGDAKSAERLFLDSYRDAKRVEEMYPLVSFYARQKQPQKALDLCEKEWKKWKLDDVVDLCMQVVSESPEDKDALARVEKLLLAARSANSSSAMLGTALGHLCVLQGRDRDAEGIYRQAIERNRKDVLAYNALAWLLSMQSRTAKEAFELTEKAIGVGGPYPWLLDTQAVALLAMGETTKAIAMLEEVAVEMPTAVVYFHLAKAHHQGKNARNARRALERATKEGLKPGDLHPTERVTLSALVKEYKPK